MNRDKPKAPLCPICGEHHWAREPHALKHAKTSGVRIETVRHKPKPKAKPKRRIN